MALNGMALDRLSLYGVVAAGFAGLGALSIASVGLGLTAALATPALIGIGGAVLSRRRAAAAASAGDGDGLADLVAERADACLAVTADDGRLLYANGAYRRLVGAASPPPPLDFLAARGVAGEAVFSLRRAARDGARLRRECLIRRDPPDAGKDPSQRLNLSLQPLREGSDLTLWNLRDITRSHDEQRQAQKRLEAQAAFFDDMPVCLFSADGEGRLRFLCAQSRRLLGIAPQRADLTLADLGFSRPFPPSLLGGDADDDDPPAVKHDFPLAEGGVLPVWILHRRRRHGSHAAAIARTTPAHSADPAALHDVIHRLFGDLPLGAAQLDACGVIESGNAALARLCGVGDESDLIGAPLASHLAEGGEDDIAQALQAARRLTDKDEAYPVNVEFARRAEDDRIDARLLIKPTFAAAAPEKAGFLVYCIDTTEQKSLEARVVQSQKMQALGQLAGGVAHDFNNLLTAIHGFCDLLLERHKPGDPAFRELHQINQNAQRASNLVRQLLAFSRRQRFRSKTISLTDCVENLTLTIGRVLGENVTLDIRHGRDLWPVRADPMQIDQVLVNLLVNARDAMPDGGEVRIRTANLPMTEAAHREEGLELKDYVMCEIIDQGVGIPHDIRDKIFDPFFTTKKLGGGTGLGLATVYGIMSQNNGSIFVDSAVGQGTAFRLFLPRAAPSRLADDEKTPPIDETPLDVTGNETILLVEDERAVRNVAAQALTLRGYRVLEAENGEEALELLDDRQDGIDLLLTDVRMPGMNGPELADKVRERFPKAKIVFISGYTEDSLQRWSDAAGTDFLPKPFRLEALISAVRQLLGAAETREKQETS